MRGNTSHSKVHANKKALVVFDRAKEKKTSYYRFDRTLYTSFMADCFVSCKTFFLKKLQQDFDQQFVE